MLCRLYTDTTVATMGNLPSTEIYAALSTPGAQKAQIIRQITPAKASKVLFVASEKKNFRVIEKLLSAKLRGDITQVTDTLVLLSREVALSILWLAAENGNGAIIELVLDTLADEDMAASDSRNLSKSSFWPNAITIAAENGHKHCLQYLMARSPELFAENGVKAAYCAAHAGELECLSFLVEIGFVQCGEFSALSAACAEGQMACVEYLLPKNKRVCFDIDQVDTCVDVPAPALVLAAEKGHTECVRLLLEHRADVEAQRPKDGSTALHAAASGGHAACVKMLLTSGADPNAVMTDGMQGTPMYCAIADGKGAAACVEHLLQAGADPNHTINYFGGGIGVTSLHAAAAGGHTACVKLLLEWGADTRAVVDGLTPLQQARTNNRVECVRLLQNPPQQVVNSSSKIK